MPARKVVLMYHSVDGPAAPAVLGSFPVTLDRFIGHVTLARDLGWTFGRLSDLHAPVERDTLYITGDDGTADWARNVLPWCEGAGIPTHTALITGPWQDQPVWPVAHRLQVLLALPDLFLPRPELTADERAYIDRVYAYERDPRRRYLKGACNVIYDDAQARELLGEPTAAEVEHLAARFAAPHEYRGLALAEFGVHTVTHRAFDGDAPRYLAEEIVPCAHDIRAATLPLSRIFTLPMRPRFPATVEQLVPTLAAQGFDAVLDGQGQWDGRSFIVPRIDAKHVEEFLLEHSGDHPAADQRPDLARHEVSR